MYTFLKAFIVSTFLASFATAQTTPTPAGTPSAPTPTTSSSNTKTGTQDPSNPTNAVNNGAIVQPGTTQNSSTQSNPNNSMSSVQPTSSRSSMTTDQIRSAQVQLSSSGYAVNADGVMGNRTAEAIRAYQRNRGLQETGWFDQQTMNALRLPSSNSDDRSPSSVDESPR